MPSDDKRGLPSLITKGIGTDLTRRRVMQGALSTVAKDLIPFAAKEILAAKDFNSLQKILVGTPGFKWGGEVNRIKNSYPDYLNKIEFIQYINNL